jgi:DNA-binding NarL/FixJ family response regulator
VPLNTQVSTRVLIGDDHPMVRRALREALTDAFGSGFEIVEAGSLSAVRDLLHLGQVDLLLLDLQMPGMDSTLSLRALRSEFPAVPILIVSAMEEARVIRQTMELGASGFLPKSAPFTAISEAVTAVLAGDLWFPETPGAAAGDSLDGQLAERIAELTPQQRRVLAMLTQGKPNKEIAFELDVHEGTVKAHVTQILQKLGVHSRTQAALVAERFSVGIGRERS